MVQAQWLRAGGLRATRLQAVSTRLVPAGQRPWSPEALGCNPERLPKRDSRASAARQPTCGRAFVISIPRKERIPGIGYSARDLSTGRVESSIDRDHRRRIPSILWTKGITSPLARRTMSDQRRLGMWCTKHHARLARDRGKGSIGLRALRPRHGLPISVSCRTNTVSANAPPLGALNIITARSGNCAMPR